MRTAVAACVALACLSLVLPSEPTYDPWAWLVWGRELTTLDLDTSGGPSWKPLPVAFTLLVSPLEHLSPELPPAAWLVVARAAGLLGLVAAWRLAARLSGAAGRGGAAAGALGAALVALTPDWLRYMAHGNEAPLALALVLWAIERHLDGARRHALALAFLCCLLRPEAFPFLLAYVVWLGWAEPESRRLSAGLLMTLPLVWLVPEWVGSGNPLNGGSQAASAPAWTLAAHDRPWLAALERGHRLVGLPVELAALAAALLAARRRDPATLALAAAASVWIAGVVAMTQLGFSGNARYFVVPVGLCCVLAAAGAVRLAAPRGAGWLVLPLLAVVAVPFAGERWRGLERQARSSGEMAAMHRDLEQAARRAGPQPGHRPAVNRPFETHLAWSVGLSLRNVELGGRGGGLVFLGEGLASGEPPSLPRRVRARMRPIGRSGRWTVLASAGPGPRASTAAQAPRAQRPRRPLRRRAG